MASTAACLIVFMSPLKLGATYSDRKTRNRKQKGVGANALRILKIYNISHSYSDGDRELKPL